jgi:hypothetical protein
LLDTMKQRMTPIRGTACETAPDTLGRRRLDGQRHRRRGMHMLVLQLSSCSLNLTLSPHAQVVNKTTTATQRLRGGTVVGSLSLLWCLAPALVERTAGGRGEFGRWPRRRTRASFGGGRQQEHIHDCIAPRAHVFCGDRQGVKQKQEMDVGWPPLMAGEGMCVSSATHVPMATG